MGGASVVSRMNRTPRELNQGGTATAETTFTSDGTLPVICHLPAAGKSGDANNVTSAMYRCRAWGRVTGGTTTNFTAALYFGTSATVADNTAVETSGAVAVNSISSNWALEIDFVVDTTSNEIHGRGWGMVDDTVTAVAALTNSPTGVDIDSDTEYGFVVTGTFSAGNASNVAVLDGFELEAL